MKTLTKALKICVYLLPTVLFFSYYPIIKLGSNNSMNFELSLPLIWLVVFDLLAFAALILSRTKRFPGISDRKIFLLSLFPFFATISIFWSMNPVRAILTAGIIWLVFFAVFALIFIVPLLGLPKDFREKMIQAILIPALAVCGFCWLQCFLDVWGVGREQSLLCRGCVSDLFGFPHPSGFAIEPQFMGNLLLAPTLLALFLAVFRRGAAQQRKPIFYLISAVVCSATLFITFSRGAIYAYCVALAIMFIFAVAQHKSRPRPPRQKSSARRSATHSAAESTAPAPHSAAESTAPAPHSKRSTQPLAADASRGPRIIQLCAIPIITFFFTLTMQGIFTLLGPTHSSFVDGVTKSLHHLSLGLIDLRPRPSTPSNSDSTSSTDGQLSEQTSGQPTNQASSESSTQLADRSDDAASNQVTSSESNQAPVFDGYVAESTNIRLNLNDIAIRTWLSAPGHAGAFWIGYDCHIAGGPCSTSMQITPTSVLFGVGLGGAGTAMHMAYPDKIPSPKEIVQNQTFSLLLELGAVGVFLAHLALVVAFLAPLLPWWFVDGKSGKKRARDAYAGQGIIRRTISKLREDDFWSSPALPLFIPLIVAYIITLNFFSGLPNALHIYLMPPLLFIMYRQNSAKKSQNLTKTS